jgi:hypothetical protein
MNRALTAFVVVLAAWLLCVLASTMLGWHPAITRPAAAVCAIALIACAVWLNRSAE